MRDKLEKNINNLFSRSEDHVDLIISPFKIHKN